VFSIEEKICYKVESITSNRVLKKTDVRKTEIHLCKKGFGS